MEPTTPVNESTPTEPPEAPTEQPETPTEPPEAPTGKGGRHRRRRRVVFIVLGVFALLIVAGGVGVWAYTRQLSNQVARIDAFTGLPTDRPTPTVPKAENILLVGSDSRDPDTTAASRTDTIMLFHLDASHQHAYGISIPRDTWITMPTMAGKGGGRAKINAAYAEGGTPLLVAAVESFTGVRIDHVVLIDFGGFQQVVNALGGVDLYIEKNITSIHPPYRTFHEGVQHLSGAEALDYVRQRKQFTDGDFSRVRHQQEFLKALLDKAASTGTIANPLKLNAFLQAITRTVSVDRDFDLVGTALDLKDLRSSDITFLTSPSSGTGMEGTQSVVYADTAKAKSLYQAVAGDRVAQWAAAHSSGTG